MHRLIIAALSLTVLAGCDGKDVQVCERSIKASLKAPATYRRAEVVSGDHGPMAWADFRIAAGIEAVNMPPQDGLSLREMIVTYDAENAFGTPVRGAGMCVFAVKNGKLYAPRDRSIDFDFVDTLDTLKAYGADMSKSELHRPALPRHRCCI